MVENFVALNLLKFFLHTFHMILRYFAKNYSKIKNILFFHRCIRFKTLTTFETRESWRSASRSLGQGLQFKRNMIVVTIFLSLRRESEINFFETLEIEMDCCGLLNQTIVDGKYLFRLIGIKRNCCSVSIQSENCNYKPNLI